MFWFLLVLAWVWCLLPTVHWLDTPDLTLSAYTLGIGHPPGQPWYVMYAGLFQWLPLGDPGFRTAIASCLSAFLGMRLAFFLVERLLSSVEIKPTSSERWILRFCFLIVAWSSISMFQVTRQEVYAPTTALVLCAIYFSQLKEDKRFQYLAWCVWGVAMGTHPLMSLVALPFLVSRGMFWRIPFLGIGAVISCYLPLRTETHPAWNFGNPDQLGQFLWFVQGELYKAYDPITLNNFFVNIKKILFLFWESTTPWITVPALVGSGLLLLKKFDFGFRWLMALALAIFPLAWMSNFWPNNPDAQGYLLPSLWLLSIISGIAWLFIYRKCSQKWLRGLLGIALLSGAILQIFQYEDQYLLNRDWSAKLHLRYLLKEIPPGALVDSASFSTFSLLRYGQVVEGARPDIDTRYRGLASIPLSRARKSFFEGKFKPFERPKIWELALSRTPNGHYGLRSEDLQLINRLVPLGWFCQVDGRTNENWRSMIKVQTKEVLKEFRTKAIFAREALVLNYLLHDIRLKLQGDFTSHVKLVLDIKELFPFFPEEELSKL